MTVSAPARNVVAVLGPTNTGKTHLAIERMVSHPSGMIGLPLRLLAREVYVRVVAKVGAASVALVTGEEKIIPPNPRFTVCTVEAMPDRADVSFLAIDEIQIAADLERGHVFTDRLLNLRGRDETLLLGAATMRGVVEKLIPGVNVVTRPRMSVLTYSGSKKITRLPRRSAVVAFSADEVYAIAELIRRQRGGAAVVLGALSPRTRNAQVELFQNGDVDFLVATDAIGMGLNLDVDHVAFASDRKFDGFQYRRLSAAEFAQVAGRAGRYTRDGTFGVTGRVDPLDDALVEALESHRFDSVKTIQWRNRVLDFSSLPALLKSLDIAPTREGLTKALPADDVSVLERAARDPDIRDLADRRERIALLWDVCQVPDYRRIAPANHADLVMTVFSDLAKHGAINEDWFASQVAYADRTDGDIDTLANRIAHIRTWTFAANRPNWLRDPVHWQETTRGIEDRLSDALHERLTQRFVDRRTSVLMRRLRENAMLEAEISPTGDVSVEGQHVGQLQGFRFLPDQSANGEDAKAIRAAAQKALAGEIARRADGVAAAGNEHFILSNDATLRWQGLMIARLVEGDDVLRPRLLVIADETLTGPHRDAVQTRIDRWLEQHIETHLKPLQDLKASEGLAPLARGVAYRIAEGLGVVERPEISEDVRTLDQDMRAGLRKLGVRFGAHHLYVPALLKPAPSRLLAMLWALRNGGLDQPGVAELPQLSAAGRTSIPVDPTFPRALYRIVGYRIAGQRAVRLDILERLADQIRPLLAWRPTPETPVPPLGAMIGGGFTVTVAMTSLLGASGDDFGNILKSLGYRMERKLLPKPAVTIAAAAAPTIAEPGGSVSAADTGGAGGPVWPSIDTRSTPHIREVGGDDFFGTGTGAAMDAPVQTASAPRSGEPTAWEEEMLAIGVTPPRFAADLEPEPGQVVSADAGSPAMRAALTAGGEPGRPRGDVPVADRGDAAPSTVDRPTDDPGAEDTNALDLPAAPSEGGEGELDSPADTPSSLEPGDAEGLDAPGGLGDVAGAHTPLGSAAGSGALADRPGEAETGEPAYIEVWRPGRADRGPRRRNDRAAEGQDRGERGARGEHQRRGQRGDGAGAGAEARSGGRRDRPAPAPAAAASEGAPRQAEGRPEAREGARRDDRRPRPEGGRRNESGPNRDRQQDKGNRRDDRRDRGRDERRPPAASPPEKRDRPIDPLSPFAALAALKAQLEGRRGE